MANHNGTSLLALYLLLNKDLKQNLKISAFATNVFKEASSITVPVNVILRCALFELQFLSLQTLKSHTPRIDIGISCYLFFSD